MSGEVRRFFVEDLPETGATELSLPEAVGRHLRVLRLKVGDDVVLFDGSGRESVATLTGIEPATCVAGETTVAKPQLPAIHLIQALPKGKKLESIVRMATEIGVDAVHLAITDRTVSRPDGPRGEGRARRLERIATEATRQARRRTVPRIHAPVPLAEAAARAPRGAPRFIFWEESTNALGAQLPVADSVWAVVGGEGGLAAGEVEELRALGWVDVGLGPTILRVETAAPVIVGLLLDRAGRLLPLTGPEGIDGV